MYYFFRTFRKPDSARNHLRLQSQSNVVKTRTRKSRIRMFHLETSLALRTRQHLHASQKISYFQTRARRRRRTTTSREAFVAQASMLATSSSDEDDYASNRKNVKATPAKPANNKSFFPTSNAANLPSSSASSKTPGGNGNFSNTSNQQRTPVNSNQRSAYAAMNNLNLNGNGDNISINSSYSASSEQVRAQAADPQNISIPAKRA